MEREKQKKMEKERLEKEKIEAEKQREEAEKEVMEDMTEDGQPHVPKKSRFVSVFSSFYQKSNDMFSEHIVKLIYCY